MSLAIDTDHTMLGDTTSGTAIRLGSPIRSDVAETEVVFTFDVHAGALRRTAADELRDLMLAAGVDVSWVDARDGWFGLHRRFTVHGPRSTVQQVITEIGDRLGWRPGAVLPRLYR